MLVAEFYRFPQWILTALVMIVALCIVLQTLTVSYSIRRLPAGWASGVENGMECAVLATLFLFAALLGQVQYGLYGSFLIPSAYSFARQAVFLLCAVLGAAQALRKRLKELTGCPPLCTVAEAEPIGPQKLLDVLVAAPCTGNTLGKLAAGITDTAVTMAVKAHLRNDRPVVLALATNDGLSGSAASIGTLLNRRGYYFVPFGQDDPEKKPRSLMADFSRIEETVAAALEGRQLQPILL